MPQPTSTTVVEGQFDDCDECGEDKIELIPSRILDEKIVDKGEGSSGDENIDDYDYDDEDEDEDMEEIRGRLTSARMERNATEASEKSRGGGSDGGKNLKFLNKIFVGDYQPSSSLASKVTNELNATNKGEKIRTKDKSHRATTEQVSPGLVRSERVGWENYEFPRTPVSTGNRCVRIGFLHL